MPDIQVRRRWSSATFAGNSQGIRRCRGKGPAGGGGQPNTYQWQAARRQFHGEPLRGRLLVEVTIYSKTKRRADWDNFHKLSMDALSGIVWEDESRIERALVQKCYEPKNPRIVIEVTSVEG